MKAHVSQAKKDTVKELTGLMKNYPIVGALNMEGLPARQLQTMRETLRGKCVIRMTKRRLIHVALQDTDKEKKGISELDKHLRGMPALLFTKENPFTLFKTLKKNKSPAPAKGGQTAPKDILIPAGATPFAPGPIIGELGKFGLKTGVENGKVAIKEEKVVLKEGETINQELAGLLTRLQIYPMEVGLDLTAVYEEGEILTKNILDIDEEQYLADLTSAAAGAYNLGINAGIYNDITTPAIIKKAVREARSLSKETGYLTKDTANDIIAHATAIAISVASSLPEDARPAGLAIQETPAATESTDDKKTDDPEPQDEETKEDDVAAGMGALFG